MNKRIRELIAQAREPLHNKNLPFNQGLTEYSTKFAELIVKECANIADKNSPMSFPDHGIKIRRHFGVEEK